MGPELDAQDLDHILTHTAELWEPLRGQRIFITGGTGFVGTWLTESFAWINEKLKLQARAVLLTRNPDAFRAKASQAAHHPAIDFLRGEGVSFEFPKGEFPFVIHGATEKWFEPTAEEPAGTFERDLGTTRRVLEFAASHGTKRLLFTSSGAVYGKQPPQMTHIPEEYSGAPATEDAHSAYGQAKRAGEFLCAMYARQFGFAAVLARLFAFAGPHLPLDINFAIGNFVRDVLAGGPVRIGGDGTPRRSYLYAADLAIWLWTLLMRGESARPYNVGSADDISIADLAKLVVENTAPGTPIEILGKPSPGMPPARYVPSIERARNEVGLQPLVPLDQAIRRMYAWNVRVRASQQATTP